MASTQVDRPRSEELIFHDGDAFFQNLSLAIQGAQSTIDFESYIFDHDQLGQSILQNLILAAQKGVRVRLLLDGVGSNTWSWMLAEEYRTQGVDIRFFHPLPWQKSGFRFWKYLTVRKTLLGIFKLNHRNHRKVVMIDRRVLYIGSMNVSDRHLVSVSNQDAWRDTSLKVVGENLDDLLKAFEAAWNYSQDYFIAIRKKIKDFVPSLRLRLNHSKTQGQYYRQQLIECFRVSKDRIWITTPYFVPDRTLFRSLVAAAKRGVDVRILLPSITDFRPGKYAAQSYYQRLLKAGATLFEYSPSMLHAKIIIADQLATVGSSNLNHRSIFQDLEADVILRSPHALESLSQQFMIDLSVSTPITLSTWRHRPWTQRFLEQLFLRFRRLL